MKRQPGDGHLQGRRILVVEDEYLIAADLTELLEDLGAVVVGPARSVKEALGRLERDGAPDAALLDINLGHEKAFPIADALIERGVPFIFTTGYSNAAIPANYQHVPRCEKPVEMRTVTELLAGQMSP